MRLRYQARDDVSRRGRAALPLWGATFGLCLILSASGCGSSDSGESTAGSVAKTGSGVTKTQLIRQGDRICKETEERQEKALQAFVITLGPNVNLSEERQAVKVVLHVGLPTVRRQFKELRALGTPGEDRELLEGFYAETQKAIEKAAQDPESMLTIATNPFNKPEEIAAQYGFKVCGGA